MSSLDLDALKRFTAQAQKLQAIAAELQPFLELLKEFGDKAILPIPADRLIRTGEVAEILKVGKAAIGAYVDAGLLTPLYTADSPYRKFWLSEVKSLAKKEPWCLKDKSPELLAATA